MIGNARYLTVQEVKDNSQLSNILEKSDEQIQSIIIHAQFLIDSYLNIVD